MSNDRHTDNGIETSTKRTFDASVERLDGATLSRLSQARAAAVEAAAGHGRRRVFGFGNAGLVGLGVAAALAVAVAWLPQRTPAPGEALTAFDDLDILLEEESLELFEELEFYAWLDAQAGPDAGEADGSG